MDINSLLSHEEPSAQQSRSSSTSQPPLSPRKKGRPNGGKRTSSGLSHEVTLSPPRDIPRSNPQPSYNDQYQQQQHQYQHQHSQFPPYPPQHAAEHDQRQAAQKEAQRPEFRGSFGGNTPFQSQHYQPVDQQRPTQYMEHRHSSTPQMETLADLAAMQQPRQSISLQNAAALNSAAQRSPSVASSRPSGRMPPNVRTNSASDLVMAEAPTSTPPPRNFTTAALSDVDSQAVTDLTSSLAQNSYDYNSHVELISLLHRGFASHLKGSIGDALIPVKASDYNLLPELRQAREAMSSRYAVGESIWEAWIKDETALAKSPEERTSVMQLCMRATSEEPASVKLWTLYGEFVWDNYAVAHDFAPDPSDSWTDEDKMICREIFTRDLVLSTWGDGVSATRWRIDESQQVWDRYVELIMQDFPERPSQQTVDEVRDLYMNRLQVPHATWEQTSQAFWPFISRYDGNNWEAIMAATNEAAAPAKQQYALREDFESNLRRASENEDQASLFNVFSTYLAWEAKPKRRSGKFETELRTALYDRALLRFPTMIEWWLDYVDFITSLDASSPRILPLLENATRHCPWSGELWSRRLLRVELETHKMDEVEGVKHKATNSGLLIVGGIEEMLIVQAAWCSFLRRRAFEPKASEDEADVAEMAIAEVLGDIRVQGNRAYGNDFQGDPLWRVEKIWIKFLTQAERFDEARTQWKELVSRQGHSYDFWSQYYNWEIYAWGWHRIISNKQNASVELAPSNASAVLREALKQKNLDWPEKILELFAHHFQEHEVPEEVQKAQIELRSAQRRLRYKREREAEAAAAQLPQEEAQVDTNDSGAVKRKREDETNTNGDGVAKRSKVEEQGDIHAPNEEGSASASAQIKRDREHNTITIKNLTSGVSEKTLRQFFADCGKILNVALINEADQTITATMEFETHEDVLAARSRDGKEIDGSEIHIQSGSQSTLYVANYPADFDEVKIRELFDSYGTIVSVRFPSLKYDQRRRFCYIQFLTPEEASAATALDNKALAGHALTAKISDPDAKKKRTGALAEGREIVIKNIDFKASDDELKDMFKDCGTIENVRRIKAPNGRTTGTGFIIFSTPDEAKSALIHNNKPLKSRILSVAIAEDRTKTSQVVRPTAPSASPAPEDASTTHRPSVAESPKGSIVADEAPSSNTNHWNDETARTRHERTIALLKLSDTVNDARIESFFRPYGSIKKIVMQPYRNGAIIEFEEVAAAGKVQMGVDCSVLGAGTRVGTVAELTSKGDRGGKSGQAKMRPAQAGVSRPSQRGGRRGGLGFKRDGGFAGDREEAKGETEKKEKSNADFRALFVRSGEGGDAKDEENAEKDKDE